MILHALEAKEVIPKTTIFTRQEFWKNAWQSYCSFSNLFWRICTRLR